ncbi:MAG: RNA polymerase sigma factor, partial [Kiritimatiellae bacterium]|nr:RNA polymerase sigma factor [Kiritimatiellia bacterium]
MDIIEELRQNREAGARRLEAEYKVGLMSLARRFCHDPGDAEELVNATFAKVVDNIDDYLEQSAFFAWMCQILTNLFRDGIRRKSSQMEVYPGEVPDVADTVAQEKIYANLDASLLRDAISTLPPKMRDVVVMRYFMDLPLSRIAKLLSVPEGTVNSRLRNARLAIAAKLGVAARKPGGKAVLLAIALCGLAALGAGARLAVVRLLSSPPAAGFCAQPEAAAASQVDNSRHALQLSTFNDNSQGETMNTRTLLSAATAATLAASATAATVSPTAAPAELSAAVQAKVAFWLKGDANLVT